ncbi:MAG: hypothetical protein H0X24_03395 [Ktedonobacterales bacterium]|nr:hypothetical protein [Ktedonobacterales bacterium]
MDPERIHNLITGYREAALVRVTSDCWTWRPRLPQIALHQSPYREGVILQALWRASYRPIWHDPLLAFCQLRGTGVLEVAYPNQGTTVWVNRGALRFAVRQRVILGVATSLPRRGTAPFPPRGYGTVALRFAGRQHATLLVATHLAGPGVQVLAEMDDLLGLTQGYGGDAGYAAWFRRFETRIPRLMQAYAQVPLESTGVALAPRFAWRKGSARFAVSLEQHMVQVVA